MRNYEMNDREKLIEAARLIAEHYPKIFGGLPAVVVALTAPRVSEQK